MKPQWDNLSREEVGSLKHFLERLGVNETDGMKVPRDGIIREWSTMMTVKGLYSAASGELGEREADSLRREVEDISRGIRIGNSDDHVKTLAKALLKWRNERKEVKQDV